MNLIPFDQKLSELVFFWNTQPEYRRFFCSFNRFLTKQECENLPSVLGCEVLFLVVENEIVGMVILDDTPNGMTRFAILIEKTKWGNKLGSQALEKIEEYCFKVKNSRMLFTQAFENDLASNKELQKQGHILIGKIEKFVSVNGNFESVFYYYKLKKE